ncbi:MAG: helix-turn-helix transcriptional regulator [Pseudonocardia sp.]|nr:helix-turn-helix transcriptional regulator [Pseudonocardia sp.]
MDLDDARTIGRRLRRIRQARGKSLRVIAGLAGMSTSHLWRIELGERALDLSEIGALADALQIAPSELIKLPVPAPANGNTDSAIKAVRRALRAVSHGQPGGQVVAVETLRARVMAVVSAHTHCDREYEVGSALPALIADLHTSIDAGRDVAELLDLAVFLHVGATTGWLRVAGAELGLREQAVLLGRQAALGRDTPTALALATWGGLHVMLIDGATDLALAELDATTVPTNSPESMQLAGMLALSRSLVAAAANRPADVTAPLEMAAELAERTGECNAYWMGFGPTNVGCWRMAVALEFGDHENAVANAEQLHPERHPHRGSQALYWVHYGRALSRLRGRRDDAVLALRRAELISPHQVQRDPLARDVVGELLAHSGRDSPVARELRMMARRADLPI